MLNKLLWFCRLFLYKIMEMYHWLHSGAFFINKIIDDFMLRTIEITLNLTISVNTSTINKKLLNICNELCQQN